LTSGLLGRSRPSVRAILLLTFGAALVLMRDVGFVPKRDAHLVAGVRRIAANSIEYGWRVPPVRYIMLAAPFTGGVAVYVF
jgi:hypothetical protein